MASGSSGRAVNSGSKAFDFASDDILCSYEDYGNQDGNDGNLSDPSIGANSNKEFHKSRMARSAVFPNANYSPPEESSFNQDVILTVEKTMKRHTDDLMRFLEGISSRLSQLELYCYNLDKSISEMRSDLIRDHGESDTKLKSLEKHIQEVHRSVQILRDKQELADTQKELAKLQLAQKDSKNEEKSSPRASEPKKSENSSDSNDKQLALTLPQPPHQVPPPQPPHQVSPPQQPTMAPPSSMPTQQGYYLQPPSQQPQNQYNLPPQIQQPITNPGPLPFPQYQQQWPQPGQVQPPQLTQVRPSSQPIYSSYMPNQTNQPELAPNSMPMQVPESAPYGYSPNGRPIQPQAQPQPQPQPQQVLKPGYGAPSNSDGYIVSSGPRPPPAYIMYDSEGGRTHHQPPPQPHFQGYPPMNNPQRMPNSIPNSMPNSMPNSPGIRVHPYNELVEKLVGMGYRGDHIVGVIQRLEESGQTVDFNAVLDRLNGHGSGGGGQRGWSG